MGKFVIGSTQFWMLSPPQPLIFLPQSQQQPNCKQEQVITMKKRWLPDVYARLLELPVLVLKEDDKEDEDEGEEEEGRRGEGVSVEVGVDKEGDVRGSQEDRVNRD